MADTPQNAAGYRVDICVLFSILIAFGVLFFIALGGVAGATADPDYDRDRVVPSQFDTEEGDVLWEAAVDLDSHSQPIVVDGILVTSADGDDSSDQVVAYDVGTGEQRWAMDLSVHKLTAADGTIYASGDDGVYALDLELGTIEWHADFDARGGIAVGDGTVYAVERISASSDRLTALNAETGDEEWTKETDEILSGPTVVDERVYVVHGGVPSGILTVDAATGDQQWQWEAGDGINIANGPTVADGHVYVSHTKALPGTTFDDEPGLISAVDVTDGETVWQTDVGVGQVALETVPTAPTVAAENDEPTVYVGYAGSLYALDPTDGTERWSDDNAVFDAPTVADGTLFVPQTTESTEFRSLDPNDGTERWSVATGDRSEVVVVDGVAYVGVTTGDRRLMAIDAGVTGSSSDSRIMLGGHHHKWTGEIPDADPRIVDATFDEGVFVEDELTVSATVRNDWDPTTSATYTLELDGDPQVSQTIDVPAYGTNTVELPMTAPDTAGEYALTIGDEEVGTLTVVDENDPVFRSVNPFFDTRLEGDLIQIPYDATNLGDTFVEENATLALEGPAFDGREDVASAQGPEGLDPDETTNYLFSTEPIDEPGEYTAFLEGDEIGTITVLPETDPVYLSDTNRLHDSIVSRLDAPINPEEAGVASVDVRYENLAEGEETIDSELVAYDGETEVGSVTESITVDGNSSAIERLSIPLPEQGVYELEVDGQSVGEVEVLVDGVQDGDSIQARIDAALPGDTILVGNGTYEESLTIDKPLTLRTVSDGGAVLDGSGERFERAITVTADDVTVDGFRVEGYRGSGSGFGDAAVVVGGEQFGFFNNTITDSVDGIQTESNENAHGIVIADNHIHDNDGDAIMFANRVNDASVLRNTITDNGGAGLDLGNQNDRFTVDANEIHRNADGITYEQTGGNDGEVTNNTVTDNSGAGIDLGSSSAPDNVVENNTVTGNENGITAGLRAEVRYNNVTATSGNGIDGLRFGVVANNTLKDVGSIGIEPGASTEIKYNTFTDVSIGINSDADNLEIHGNEFTGTDTDLRLERGILGEDGATVTENQFATGIILIGMPEEPHELSDNTVGGDPLVYVVGEDDPTIDGDAGQIILVDVTNADLEGFSFSDVTAGIQIIDSENISITDTEFTDISAASPTVSADDEGVVSVSDSSGVTIDDFTVTNSERGVFVTESDTVTVSNGTISATTDRGIFIDDTDDVTVEHNTITGDYNDGIRVDGSENLSIVGNEVTGETRGIGIVAATDAVVTDNTIDGTTTGVRFGQPSGSSDIQGLTFTNNTITGGSDGVTNPRGSITDGVMFTENIIIGNDGVGLDVDIGEDGGTVANNTITNNEVGMDLTRRGGTPVQNLDVTNNTIGDNEGDGLRLDGATNVTVTDNSITDNGVGLAYSGSEDLDARNNWWGAENGPSGGVSDPVEGTVAEGDGDSIESSSDAVRFDPWLETALIDTGTLSGTVTDADTGDPLADATVEVLDGKAVIDSAETEADGTYELTLAVGTYDVAASADEYEQAVEQTVAITDDETTIVDLTLTPFQAGTIEGTVVTVDGGDPIADVEIEIVEQDGVGEPPASGGFTTTTQTDEDGEFTAAVPPGVYQYTATASGFEELTEQDIVVSSGEAVDVDTIELTAVPVVTGTVTNAVTGDAIEGVSVESSATGASEPFDTAMTDTAGEYVINVPSETTQLDFTRSGYIPEQVFIDGQDIDGTEQVDVELTLEDDLGLITGTVTRESTGEPVQGAIVLAIDENDTQADGDSTAGDGVYELQVEPGTYTITATEEGGPGLPESGTVEDVTVPAGGQISVDIELTPMDLTPPSDVIVSIDENESVVDVTEDEEITVVVDITNTGDTQINQEVVLGVLDQTTTDETLYESDEVSVTIDAGETERVSFTFTADTAFDGAVALVASGEPGTDQADDMDTIGLSVSAAPTGDAPVADDDPVIESITLDVSETTLTVGATTTATVTATLDDGSTTDVTGDTAFDSDDTGVISIDGATLTAEGSGTTTVTATHDGHTDTVDVTVEDADLEVESVGLSLAETTLSVGETTTATVTATFADGSTADVTAAATFDSDAPAVVSADSSTFTAESSGTTTVTASYEGETDTVDVTVEDADLVVESIELSLVDTTLSVGETTTATVTATFTDGSTADVTADSTFESETTDVVSTDGATLTADAAGTASVSATYEGETDTVDVTVEATADDDDTLPGFGIGVSMLAVLLAIGGWTRLPTNSAPSR